MLQNYTRPHQSPHHYLQSPQFQKPVISLVGRVVARLVTPPVEKYVPCATQEEVNDYQLLYEEDCPKFIPDRFESLRSVPAYDNALKESFDRCLDLYLCPKKRISRVHPVEAESGRCLRIWDIGETVSYVT